MADLAKEFEADTLDQARALAAAQVPQGLDLLVEVVLSDGEPVSKLVTADSPEKATQEALKEMPQGAQLKFQGVQHAGKPITQEVLAQEKIEAVEVVRRQCESEPHIITVELKSPARIGLLGLGKRPPVWRVVFYEHPHYWVRFESKAKLRVEYGTLPPEGYCQNCGKPNSAWTVVGKEREKYCFCSAGCGAKFMATKLSAILAPSRHGHEIVHCWNCGWAIGLTTEKTCGSCKRLQVFTEHEGN
jgi:hypothetical protein